MPFLFSMFISLSFPFSLSLLARLSSFFFDSCSRISYFCLFLHLLTSIRLWYSSFLFFGLCITLRPQFPVAAKIQTGTTAATHFGGIVGR